MDGIGYQHEWTKQAAERQAPKQLPALISLPLIGAMSAGLWWGLFALIF